MALFVLSTLLATSVAALKCKITPSDQSWPTDADWSSLNSSIHGTLLRTVPVASSCWPGNPFNSTIDCGTVKSNWTSAYFHGRLPESVDYPIFTNKSCLPPGAVGYEGSLGCTVKGLPRYIVKAEDAESVAVALKWAADREIRVVIKGTGHDLCGRSSGANSLSIWTRNLRKIQFYESWSPENSDEVWSAAEVGAGWSWGEIYEMAGQHGKAVVGGGTGTVGIGGHTGAGGHGPLTAMKGLASDNILQVTVATTEGKVYVANDNQHRDLFWAIRGGGPGVYGVITSYTIRTYPTPNAVFGRLQIQGKGNTTAAISAAWDAVALISNALPSWMDDGVSGTTFVATGSLISTFIPGALSSGPALFASLNSFNSTIAAMNATILHLLSSIDNENLIIMYNPPVEFPTFYDWFNATHSDMPVANYGIQSSRLLSKTSMQSLSAEKIKSLMTPQNSSFGSVLVLNMAAGCGVSSVPIQRQGAVLPAWRDSYIHAIASTAYIQPNDGLDGMSHAGSWMNGNTERKWEEIQPEAGSYVHESNQFMVDWKEKFWGRNYEALREVKGRYDPRNALYVAQGVGSDDWIVDEGRLCKL